MTLAPIRSLKRDISEGRPVIAEPSFDPAAYNKSAPRKPKNKMLDSIGIHSPKAMISVNDFPGADLDGSLEKLTLELQQLKQMRV